MYASGGPLFQTHFVASACLKIWRNTLSQPPRPGNQRSAAGGETEFHRRQNQQKEAVERKKLSGVVAYQKVLKMAQENHLERATLIAKEAVATLAFQLVRKIYQSPKYPEKKQDLKFQEYLHLYQAYLHLLQFVVENPFS